MPLNTDTFEVLGLEACDAANVLTDPVQGCIYGLLYSGFQLERLDLYGKWYSDSSKVQVAETGDYVGVDAITEYIAFGALTGQYFSVGYEKFPDNSDKRLPVVITSSGSIQEGGGTCQVALVSSFLFDFDKPDTQFLNGDDIVTKGGTMSSTVLGTYTYDYTYTLADGTFTIEIDTLRALYPSKFWEAFAYKFQTTEFEDYLCTTMKDKCDSTWDENGFKNQPDANAMETCKNRVRALPRVDSESGWTGESLGCRLLHGAFVARGNDYHCNHISFRQLEDPKGNVKCQGDGNTDDYMTVQERAIADFVGAQIFLQSSDGFGCTGDCFEEEEEEV